MTHIARRKCPSPKEGLKQILALEVNDPELSGQLEGLGLEPTFSNAIALTFIQRAVKGDKDAAKFVRETVEEKPAEPAKPDKGGEKSRKSAPAVRALNLQLLSDQQLEEMADQADCGPSPD